MFRSVRSAPGVRTGAALLAGLVAAGVALASPMPARAATFTVNRIGDQPDRNLTNSSCDTSANAGNQCTLRAALQQANYTAGADTINFNITSTSKTIAPGSPLPAITEPLTINGFTQSGATANTSAAGNNAVLRIVLDGVNAGADVFGLHLNSYDAVIRGLVIQRFDGAGIFVDGTTNVIRGNFIGTAAGGGAARGNQIGILINGAENVVGGDVPAARNLISGNVRHGIALEGAGARFTVVQGNFIGTNKAGTTALANGEHGVFILNAPDNTIGGTTAGARNVISGNGDNGIYQDGEDTGIAITGNYIGTNAAGTAAVGNFYRGVTIRDAINATVGGTVAGARNVISGNRLEGLEFVFTDGGTAQGNLIGTKADGTGDLGNGRKGMYIVAGGVVVGGTGSAANVIANSTEVGVHVNYSNETVPVQVLGNVIRSNGFSGVFISDDGVTVGSNLIFQNGEDGVQVHANAQGVRITGNQIHGNGQLGIDLLGGTENAAGVTANDTDDPDTGANNLQNFPVLTSATKSSTTGGTTVVGALNSNPSTEFRIELFAAAADASGHGEAQLPLATQNVTTNANGDTPFVFTSNVWSLGMVLTATATAVAAGSTSEFSANRTVVVGP